MVVSARVVSSLWPAGSINCWTQSVGNVVNVKLEGIDNLLQFTHDWVPKADDGHSRHQDLEDLGDSLSTEVGADQVKVDVDEANAAAFQVKDAPQHFWRAGENDFAGENFLIVVAVDGDITFVCGHETDVLSKVVQVRGSLPFWPQNEMVSCCWSDVEHFWLGLWSGTTILHLWNGPNNFRLLTLNKNHFENVSFSVLRDKMKREDVTKFKYNFLTTPNVSPRQSTTADKAGL